MQPGKRKTVAGALPNLAKTSDNNATAKEATALGIKSPPISSLKPNYNKQAARPQIVANGHNLTFNLNIIAKPSVLMVPAMIFINNSSINNTPEHKNGNNEAKSNHNCRQNSLNKLYNTGNCVTKQQISYSIAKRQARN